MRNVDGATVGLRAAGRLLACAVVLALLAGCVQYVSGKDLVKPKRGYALTGGPEQAAVPPWTIEPLSLVTEDGAVLRGARFMRPDAKATVLYYGGNIFTLSRYYHLMPRVFGSMPVNVIAYDYRGYGGSTGTPTLDLVFRDSLALYDHTRSAQGQVVGPLLVYGHSFGAFVALKVASQRPLDALALEALGTDLDTVVRNFREVTPWWTFGTYSFVAASELHAYDNRPLMRMLDEPLLMLVGDKDVSTPPEMSRELFALAPLPADRKRLLLLPDGSHRYASASPEFPPAFVWLMEQAGARLPAQPAKPVQ